jgi:hypothetical protein
MDAPAASAASSTDRVRRLADLPRINALSAFTA